MAYPPISPAETQAMLARAGLTCAAWLALPAAERVRRLVVAHWSADAAWQPADAARLQAMVDAVQRACAAVVAPAGQPLVPLDAPGPYWLGQTGLTCAAWSSMPYAARLGALSGALASAGQTPNGATLGSLAAQIDAWCAGIAASSAWLSPYAYPYAPYRFGYGIPWAFPWIVSGVRFGPVFGGGFGGGFRGGFGGGGHGGGGGGGHGGH